MKGRWLNIDGVVALLRKQVCAAGGQNVWARNAGISEAYVSDVLSGRRLPGNKITRAMGLEKALMWRSVR